MISTQVPLDDDEPPWHNGARPPDDVAGWRRDGDAASEGGIEMREELEVAAAAPEDTAGTELADLGPPAPRSPSRPGSPATLAAMNAARLAEESER